MNSVSFPGDMLHPRPSARQHSVIGDVPVAACGAEVAAGHRQPLGGIGFLLTDDRPFGADMTVGRAGVLRAQAEPVGGADRRGLARPAAGQYRQQPARLVAVTQTGTASVRPRCLPLRSARRHARRQELLALGSAHGNHGWPG
jgi:hypothetical protein